MDSNDLKPGDMAIDLAALARASGTFAGALASAACTWTATHSFLYAAIAVVVGGPSGYFIGRLTGRWLLGRPKEGVLVVKKNRRSLPVTVRTASFSSLASALVCSAVVGALTHSPPTYVLYVTLVIGIATGVIFACLSSLT
jgi:hypothetical protein